MSKVKLDEIGLIPIKDLNNSEGLKSFYVARYQRGYKWGQEEIESLLNDIAEKKDSKLYCLQPLVVVLKQDGEWELIDGQQRMTTIKIILSVLKNKYSLSQENNFQIKYNTRVSSEAFLLKIAQGQIELEIPTQDVDLIKQFVIYWDKYIIENTEDDNIDNYHLLQSYYIISNWLENSTFKPEDFYKKLIDETAVIWYPIQINNSSQSYEDIFLNLNSGKIKLTSAELIKALFILEIEQSNDSWEIRNFKKNDLAQEWDAIEKSLHDDGIWFFINNNNSEYHTRIGVLFDIISGRGDSKNELFSYYQYAQRKLTLNWDEVKALFQRIEEWYNDIFLYHRIGFLINDEIKKIEDIVKETKDKTKSKILEHLDGKIIEHFKKERTVDNKPIKRFNLDNLDYEAKREDCQSVLLLYNIISIEKMFPGQRFPFNLYQQKKWTIEHIHPQNPKKIQSIKEAKDWLGEYKARIDEANEPETKEKLLNILEKIQPLKDEDKISLTIQDELKEFIEEIKDLIGLHKIGNLALLDNETNSKIGNKKFLSKRKELLELSQMEYKDPKDVVYIPMCTINNFLKKSNLQTQNLQMSFWSKGDADSYKNDIEKTITNKYLPQ